MELMKMEDFVEDCYAEIDEDYEFDAAQFFDFTRPELDSQIEEVERWFQVSGDYPHSPFIVKLELDQILAVKSPKSRKSSKNSESSPSKKISKGKGQAAVEEVARPKIKQLSQSHSSKFMEPTASHLAKQNTHQLSTNHSTSFPRARGKLDRTKSSPLGLGSHIKASPIGFNNLGSKRQKLEIGFLNKLSHLKHKFSLSHKSIKEVAVPKESGLEALLGSQRQRSKNNSASSESETPKHRASFKDQSSNPKILQTRSLPRPAKSKAQLTEFQEFHFKTSERANHHSAAKENRSLSKTSLESSLTEEFDKLSLGSKSKTTSKTERQSPAHSKGSSSGRSSRGSFQSEFWRPPNQNCGGRVKAH